VAGRRAIAELPIDPGVRALAKLAASELITNSLEHAGLRQDDVIELSAAIEHDCLRIAVCDPGPGPGRRMRPGLGLRVVERASDRWGIDRGPEQTCCWFEIDLGAAAPAQARAATCSEATARRTASRADAGSRTTASPASLSTSRTSQSSPA
jgi:hypothetical protein